MHQVRSPAPPLYCLSDVHASLAAYLSSKTPLIGGGAKLDSVRDGSTGDARLSLNLARASLPGLCHCPFKACCSASVSQTSN